MRLIHLVVLTVFTVPVCSSVLSQQTELFKQVDTTRLYLEIFVPDQFDSSQRYPAMVFFFGGGWISGRRDQFKYHAQYFSKRGMVCFLADYRAKKDITSPFQSLQDAKSAIRYIRSNHHRFKIDTAKLVAAGGSAGGHLAAATALTEGYNESTDNLEVSCKPNALVLFNPVIDNGPGGYGYERIGDQYKLFSPLHNLKKGAPPTIIFLGTKDALIPVQTVEYYKVVMEKLGSRCDLKLYKDQPHGFFNHVNFEYYKLTILEADSFLQSLGLLKQAPQINIE